MSTAIELTLPWPPSLNRYWRNVAGRTLISRDGRAYRSAVAWSVPAIHKQRMEGRLLVTIAASPPDRRKRDLDNMLKAVLDSLSHAGVYVDDSQIDYLSVERRAPKKGGEMRVCVQEQVPAW